MKKIYALISFILCAAIAQAQYWQTVPSGTYKQLMSISFPSNLVGYISGADSLLLKTTDGGNTWQPIAHTGMDFSIAAMDIVDINFITETIGFAIVSNFDNPQYSGLMHKTTDGGATWTPVTSGTIAPWSTFFFDENNGYQVGSAFFAGCTLLELQNSTWQPEHNLNYDPSQFLYTIDCYDNNTCIAGGSGGYVYRTFDGGTTWDTVYTVSDSAIYGLLYINSNFIVGGTNDPMGGIIYSDDGGDTWQTDPNSFTFFYPVFREIVRSQRDSFIAVGKLGHIPDQGYIQNTLAGFNHFEMTNHPMYGVAMRDDSIAFAVGDSGLIESNLKTITNVSEPLVTPTVSLYPNPASSSFSTSMNADHTIKVFDITGRMVYEDRDSLRTHVIDMKGRTRGTYLVQATLKDGRSVYEKIVVE